MNSKLYEAIQAQDTCELNTILSKGGINLEQKDDDGRTPISLAAQTGYYDGVKSLIQQGADLEARNDGGFTPLHIASENSHAGVVRLLLKENAQINVRDNIWNSAPIICASFWGSLDIARMLLEADADVSVSAVFEYSPLSLSCIKGYTAIAMALLEHGKSDLEKRSVNGATPLILAAGSGHTDIIEPLLKYGADINARDNRGIGILHILVQSKDIPLATSLIEKKKPDINVQDAEGLTPLHVATTEKSMEMVKVLIRNGADVNIQDKLGNTPMHIAAVKAHEDIVIYFLSVGANTKIVNKEGLQPIDCAYGEGHSYIVEVLKRVSQLNMDALAAKTAKEIEIASKPKFELTRSVSAPIPAPRPSKARSRTDSTSTVHTTVSAAVPQRKTPSYIEPIPVFDDPPRASSIPVVMRSPIREVDESQTSADSALGNPSIASDDFPHTGEGFIPSQPKTLMYEPAKKGSYIYVDPDAIILPKKSEHKHRKFSFPFFKGKHKGSDGKSDGGKHAKDGHLSSSELRDSSHFKELERLKLPKSMKDAVRDVYMPYSRIMLQDLIGMGHFGRVYFGQIQEDDERGLKKVAIKTIKNSPHDLEATDEFLKEALMMKGLHHMHVLNLIGISFDVENNPLAIIPFMAHGNLRAYIRDPSREMSVIQLLNLGLQVGRGMEYLSHQKFIHRDLACRNCMIDDNLVVKVADFGLSRDLFEKAYYRISDKMKPLPVRWMAPESLKSHIFVHESDVWSYGIVLWELLTRGGTPYENVENWDLKRYIDKGFRLDKPQYCPSCVYDVMLKCWEGDFTQRPSFSQIVTSIENSVHTLTIGASSQVSPAGVLTGNKVYFV